MIHNSPAVMKIRIFVAILSRNPQYDFPKMRGGVKGRLELFRKFIRFGDAVCPLSVNTKSIKNCSWGDFFVNLRPQRKRKKAFDIFPKEW